MDDSTRNPIAAFVSADAPDTAREEAHELELLRAGEAGEVAVDDLPQHVRDRVLLRQFGISVAPFAAERNA